jgi:hypothetical protein
MVTQRPLVVLSLLAALGASRFLACSSSDDAASPLPDAGPSPDAGTLDGDSPDAAPPGPGSALPWTSGTRLRARVTTVGAARMFVGWHDLTLNVDCRFGVASDGKVRCLPSDAASSFYDDVGCTTAVGVIPNGTTPKYLSAPNAAFVCGKGPAFYLPGATYTPTDLFQHQESGCEPAGSAGGAFTYVHLGALVDPATFAAATEALEPRGARLSARQYVASDGAKEDVGMQDAARASSRCSARDVRNGDYSCIPDDLAYQEVFFSDDKCQSLVGFHPGYAQQVCDRTPTAVQDSTPASAGKTLTFFEVGAKVTGTIYENNGASCLPYVAPASLGATYYATGAPLPLTAFAPFTRKNEGTGRVLLTVARTDSGALGAVLGFYDTMKNSECAVQRATDGQMRCIARTLLQVNSFADDKCSIGIYEVPAGTAVTAGALLDAQSAVPEARAVMQLGAKIAVPTALWSWNGTNCTASGIGPTDDYYATTTLPPADFVLATTAPE